MGKLNIIEKLNKYQIKKEQIKL